MRLCADEGAADVSALKFNPLGDPSAVLFRPWDAGDCIEMGLAAMSPCNGAFAASMRSSLWASTRFGDGGIACVSGTFRTEEALDSGGDVISVSPAVEVERLLEDEGSRGTEKVLDAADMQDSCESGGSRLYIDGMGVDMAVLRSSKATRRESLHGASSTIGQTRELTHSSGVERPAVYHSGRDPIRMQNSEVTIAK